MRKTTLEIKRNIEKWLLDKRTELAIKEFETYLFEVFRSE